LVKDSRALIDEINAMNEAEEKDNENLSVWDISNNDEVID